MRAFLISMSAFNDSKTSKLSLMSAALNLSWRTFNLRCRLSSWRLVAMPAITSAIPATVSSATKIKALFIVAPLVC